MNSILLVFDDYKEANFFEANLAENKINVLKSSNLEEALALAKKTVPEMIVINILYSENEIVEFCKKIKTEVKNTSILSLADSENYYSSPYINHLIIKPIRPKLLLSIIRSLMNHEMINWYPSIV